MTLPKCSNPRLHAGGAQVLMSSVYNYKNSAQAIGSLLQQAGPAGLLKGYWMTNLAWIPWK